MSEKTLSQSQKKPAADLRELVESEKFKQQIARVLPEGMTPDRFVRVTLTAALKNPNILKTTRDSLFKCLLELSAIGLEPDGRVAHLIPRKKNAGKPNESLECTFLLDYKGYKTLFHRNRDIIEEHCDVVREGDHFEVEFGSRRKLEHKPQVRHKGAIYAAYAFVRLPDGGEVFDVMNSEEIEAVRKRSPAANDGPWASDWSEMAKKTVFRRLAKGLPLSPRTREAMEAEDSANAIEMVPIQAKVAHQQAGEAGQILQEGNGETDDEKSEKTPEKAGPQIPPESAAPTMPAETPQSPPEPISGSSEEKTPESDLERVRDRLKGSGYSEEELVALLKEVRLMTKAQGTLEAASAKALAAVLEEWENVLSRLQQQRAKAAAQAAEPERDRSEI
jgi:recombination protein RecT